MGKTKSGSGKPSNLITNWVLGEKRKPDEERIRSPTNETSSPEKKSQKSTSPMSVNSENHAPEPRQESPQRDKSDGVDPTTPTGDETQPGAMETQDQDKGMQGAERKHSQTTHEETGTQDRPPQIPDSPTRVPEGKEVPYAHLVSPVPTQEDNLTGTKETQGVAETGEQGKLVSKTGDEPKETSTCQKSFTSHKDKAKSIQRQYLQSALKSTFSDRAKSALRAKEPLLPRWTSHRIACLFEIDRPENKSARTQILSTELNKMLTAARDYISKTFVRKYREHLTPRDNERREWITKFDRKKASDLNDFTFGFYGFQAPRGGLHRLLIQIIVPVGTNISDLIMNVNNHSWANKNGRRIMDIKEQNLYAPKQVGWLFRSNYVMGASTELQEAFENRGGIPFGLTFKTIPLKFGTRYDKETAVKAICISANEEDQDTAWSLLMEWYNVKLHSYPLGIPMKFVPSNDHPDIVHNPAAAQNISTLMERQRIFLTDMESIPCPSLAFPDERIGNGMRTLRHELMDITATTMGREHLGAKLFHAISKKTSMDGNTTYHFTYHKALEREAHSVVSGLGSFIAKELKLDPDTFCFPHTLSDSYEWDKKKRCVHNATTAYLAELADGKDTDDEEEEESEGYSMNSKHKRESRRIMGLNDEETVTDITKKKPKRTAPVVPTEIKDDGSAVSAISGFSVYSSSTAASKERKNLRNQISDQHELLEEQEAEIAKLRSLIATQKIQENGRRVDQSTESVQAKKTPDGWDLEIELSDDDEGKQLQNQSLQNESKETAPTKSDPPHERKVVDLSNDLSDPEEEEGIPFTEEDFYDEEGNEISYLKEVSEEVDGLRFIARGAPEEMKTLGAIHKKDNVQVFMSHSFQFSDPTEEWVELFEILDSEKVKLSYDIEVSKKRISSVRFSEHAQLKEFDPGSGALAAGVTTKVASDENSLDSESGNSSSNSASPDDSSSGSGSASQSQHSGSSSSEDSSQDKIMHTRELTTAKKQRNTSVTSEVINEATEIYTKLSAGDGPGFHV